VSFSPSGGSLAQMQENFFILFSTTFTNRVSVTSSLSTLLGLTVGSTEPYPVYTGVYSITDGFFGSHTVAGITYTWERGVGW
jgi:hypothetical protein